MATMSQLTELPLRVEDWTREQVRFWLTGEIKVDKKHADKLYEEEVSGKELVYYQPKHLQELGIKHGPAVRIITCLKLKIKEQESYSSDHCFSMDTMSQQKELPHRVEDWTRAQVHFWLTGEIKVDKKHADKLYEEEVSGKELVYYQPKHLQDLGIKHGPAVRIITDLEKLKMKEQVSYSSDPSHTETRQDTIVEKKYRVATDQTEISKNAKESKRKAPPSQSKNIPRSGIPICTSYKENEPTESTVPKTSDINAGEVAEKEKHMKSGSLQHSCSLHPFDQNSASHQYIQNYTLPPETGPGNLIEPVHEYKFLGRAKDFNEMKKKFNREVFRFAAGCMNCRTNGTIHFGVADSKDPQYAHAEIIGVSVDKETIIDHFNEGFKSYFEDQTDEAKACIRQPRFVEVLCPNSTLSGKYVIEVDVVPSHSIVQGKLFCTQTLDEDNPKKKSKGKSLFIRDGAATRDIFKIGNQKDMQDELFRINERINGMDNRREEAEKRPGSKGMSNQGGKLKNLLTCGGSRLDLYDYYIIVTNKSNPEQLQHLQFMTTLKPFCVLDYDPDSVVNGSCHKYRDVQTANLHKPSQFYEDPYKIVEDLNLYKQTSWVFCNGRADLDMESDKPLQPSEWIKCRAGEVQDMISFLCNPDTLPRGQFLVIFLLLSNVEAMHDPIFDTFMSFYKNLQGIENTLSICTSDASFQKWRDFIQSYCQHDISQRTIYDLELSEVNGTILKLAQNKQTAPKFLPSAEGSTVILQNEDKDLMSSLDILCENECENEFDGRPEEFEEFKIKTESEFYKGGQVKWWNFFFSEKEQSSEQSRAKPFIKRDKYSKLKKCIRSQTKNPKSTCVMVNLFHHPGCGGTTMAKHVMWNLRKEFRCAVLKDNNVSKEEVAQHVAYLIKYGKSEHSSKIPVLLLVEDSDETENALKLKREFTREMGALVIILNCIRTKTPKDRHKKSVDQSVFITAKLSGKEKHAFEMKFKELQETSSFTTENFYSFMIMTTNFKSKYVKNVVTNILKDFSTESKQAQLFCILALLNSHLAEPAVSVPICESFLGIKSALWGRESVLENMEPYSCLLIEHGAEEYGGLKAIRFVHQLLALECVKQLEENHNCSRKGIVLDLFRFAKVSGTFPWGCSMGT